MFILEYIGDSSIASFKKLFGSKPTHVKPPREIECEDIADVIRLNGFLTFNRMEAEMWEWGYIVASTHVKMVTDVTDVHRGLVQKEFVEYKCLPHPWLEEYTLGIKLEHGRWMWVGEYIC